MTNADFYINVQRNFILNSKEGEGERQKQPLHIFSVPLLNWHELLLLSINIQNYVSLTEEKNYLELIFLFFLFYPGETK